MKLFDSYKLGDLTLKNRIVMAPLTRSRAINNIPNELMATYYSQRASAGLIITEGTSPSSNGLGYSRIPGVFSTEQVEAWKKTTTAVHKADGKIFLQIMHTGRVSHPDNLPEGAEVLAPSAVSLDGEMYTDEKGNQRYPLAKAMTTEQVKEAQQEFINAAKNAIEAGFDGVELHAANGYLMEQFLSPITNKRKDEYGGNTKNRNRFVIEIAEAVIKEIGAEKTGIRISPYGALNSMGAFDGLDQAYVALVNELDELGVIYVHLADLSSMGSPDVPDHIKRELRAAFSQTFILSGGYDKKLAENDIQAEHGDLVAFGRPFIANPDLPKRLQEDIALNEPDADTFYTPGKEGYTDYPFA